MAKVIIKIKGLEKFMAKMSDVKSAIIHKVLKQWTFVYLGWAQRRFVKASSGDGTWAPLSPKTIAARRKGTNSGGGNVKILRDTSTLFSALSPGISMPGSLQMEDGFSVLLGYGGGAGHPKSKRASIAQIASFHQTGGGNLPQREIIVEPDKATIDRLTSIARIDIQTELNKDTYTS